jgi:predicted Zn-dependent protease
MDRSHESTKEILLVPLGKVLMDILEEIAVALRKTYKFHVRIGRSEEPDTATYSDPRRQFDADKLLSLLAIRKREQLVAVLGVVDADMFTGEKSFVFGVQAAEKGVALIALSRLREEFYRKPPKRELFFRRAVTEAIAQVGWAAGMPPCVQRKCVLQASTSLWRLDEKGQALCADCAARWEAKFQPVRKEEPKPAAAVPAAEPLPPDPEA